jgi:hypothetical protein
LEAQLFGHGVLRLYIIVIPLGVTVCRIKLAELPGKILVVQMQPIVLGQLAFYYFFIVQNIVGYLGIF